MISIVAASESSGDPPSAPDGEDASEPVIVGELLREIGAEIRTTDAPLGGRMTAIRLSVA